MAQTLEQRRRNAKFAKEQEARMGKSGEQIKKRDKVVQKPSISPFWVVLLAFVVIGGLFFEVIARWWGQ